MNKKDVEDLIFKLNEAEHAYYVKNTPIMSDGEYDTIFNQLKEIEIENPELIFSYSPITYRQLQFPPLEPDLLSYFLSQRRSVHPLSGSATNRNVINLNRFLLLSN